MKRGGILWYLTAADAIEDINNGNKRLFGNSSIRDIFKRKPDADVEILEHLSPTNAFDKFVSENSITRSDIVNRLNGLRFGWLVWSGSFVLLPICLTIITRDLWYLAILPFGLMMQSGYGFLHYNLRNCRIVLPGIERKRAMFKWLMTPSELMPPRIELK